MFVSTGASSCPLSHHDHGHSSEMGKKVGEKLNEGDLLLEIETDKATIGEISSALNG